MVAIFGPFAATTQFYLYGRRHCTAIGWRMHSAKYNVGMLDACDLTGKVFMVTGANAGLGRCLSEYLARRGASLYMVCRNAERAERALNEIKDSTSNQKVTTLICDCSVAGDVRAMMADFARRERALDGLVCNAGVMMPQKEMTSEGFEVTLATHLLHGSYLLTQLALPLLRQATAPRVIFVSSGGMYNTGWPGWDVASGTSGRYNQEMAYAYAKRGQVLLAEAWAKKMPDIKFASCHPGWADTPGVNGWLGSAKIALAPMRTLWQGTEGIAWLCACEAAEIEGGAFYLDRSPAPKHLAGPFFTEGTYTKNSQTEIEEMLKALHQATAATSANPPVTVEATPDTPRAVA